jgi:hypothetical protein
MATEKHGKNARIKDLAGIISCPSVVPVAVFLYFIVKQRCTTLFDRLPLKAVE